MNRSFFHKLIPSRKPQNRRQPQLEALEDRQLMASNLSVIKPALLQAVKPELVKAAAVTSPIKPDVALVATPAAAPTLKDATVKDTAKDLAKFDRLQDVSVKADLPKLDLEVADGMDPFKLPDQSVPGKNLGLEDKVTQGKDAWQKLSDGLQQGLDAAGVGGLFDHLTNVGKDPNQGRLNVWDQLVNGTKKTESAADVAMLGDSFLADLINRDLSSTAADKIQEGFDRGYNIGDPGQATGNLSFLDGGEIKIGGSKEDLGWTGYNPKTESVIHAGNGVVILQMKNGAREVLSDKPDGAKAKWKEPGLTVIELETSEGVRLVELPKKENKDQTIRVLDGDNRGTLIIAIDPKTGEKYVPPKDTPTIPPKSEDPKKKPSPIQEDLGGGGPVTSPGSPINVMHRPEESRYGQNPDIDKLISKTVAMAQSKVNPVPIDQGNQGGSGQGLGGLIGGDPADQGKRRVTKMHKKAPKPLGPDSGGPPRGVADAGAIQRSGNRTAAFAPQGNGDRLP